jgi:hypothetical protein
MAKRDPGTLSVPHGFFLSLIDALEKVRSNCSLEIESLQNTIRGQNDIVTKLQQQVHQLDSWPPLMPTIVEVGNPPVQPHPQEIPPQPSTPKPNRKAAGKAANTATSTPASNKPTPATSAKVDDDAGFTTVRHKKKKKPTALLHPTQPTAKRKLVFKLTSHQQSLLQPRLLQPSELLTTPSLTTRTCPTLCAPQHTSLNPTPW